MHSATTATTAAPASAAAIPAVPERADWPAVAAAGLSTFCVVTSEMLPVGLLAPIADELRMSTGMGGLLLFVPSLLAALCAPLAVLWAGGADRRRVLCALLAALALANAASALAPNLPALLAARALVGFCIGGIWSIAGGLAGRLAPPAAVALATSVIFGGVAVASVLGVPLGAAIGALAGWRAAFGAMSALCLLALALNARLLPALPTTRSLRAPALMAALHSPGLRRGVVITLSLVAAHFMAYTFVRPLLETRAGFAGDWIGPLLFAYGVAGVAGNFVAGLGAARRERPVLLAIVAALALVLTLHAWLGDRPLAAGVLLLAWGLAYGGVSVSLQLWMLRAAPDAVEPATAWFVSAFNLGIAAGSLLGVPTVDALGLRANLLLAASCLVPAIAALLWPRGGRHAQGRAA